MTIAIAIKSWFTQTTTRDLVLAGITEAEAKLAQAISNRDHASLEVELIQARLQVLRKAKCQAVPITLSEV